MHIRFLFIIPAAVSLVLLGCTVVPAEHQTDVGRSENETGDTLTDAPNEATPENADSLEVAHDTGALKVTLTASGTILVGNQDARNTLVTVLDYDCVYCRQFLTGDLPWIEREYIETEKLKIERVFAPMTPAGEFAAKLALCSAAQNKFTEADAWLQSHTVSGTNDTVRFTKAVPVNAVQLKTCLARKDALTGNAKRAAELGIERVPFFVMGKDSWLGLLTRDELIAKLQSH